jgi:hypothetical protein
VSFQQNPHIQDRNPLSKGWRKVGFGTKLNRGEIFGEMAYSETRHFRIDDAYLQSMLAFHKQFCNNGERRLGFLSAQSSGII